LVSIVGSYAEPGHQEQRADLATGSRKLADVPAI
jgi:hypothetical protein